MSKTKVQHILAGDIGGTKTQIALLVPQGSGFQVLVSKTYPSRDHASFLTVLHDFKNLCPHHIDKASFGVAGPVVGNVSKPTNLNWTVDAREIAETLRLQSVGLINDLVANAWGISALKASDFATLRRGKDHPRANRALLSAGTGLGQSLLVWIGTGYQAFPSEGGHVDFAPRTELEYELLSHLWRKYKEVSYEMVLSGPGLMNIYAFLKEAKGLEEPDWLRQELHTKDPSAVISQHGLKGKPEICAQALDIFTGIFGAQAGNVALAAWAQGGIFLGGGIAPKMLPKLKSERFSEAFTNKGPLKKMLREFSVKVILNQNTALLGAAVYAHQS